MPTAKEGAAHALSNASSYGGGGVGGKFRKKPLRKPTTPYERPPVSLSGKDTRGSWLTKAVLDPASRLISYGAHRLFASVFRKRLPPPPPQQPSQKSELNNQLSSEQPEAVPNSQYGAQDPAGGECSQPITSCSGKNGMSELEQLLQQKTFTRSEIEHLTGLLHSRAGEVSFKGDEKINEVTALNFGNSQQFENTLLEASKKQSGRSHEVSTPISNSKVLGNSIASPTEVAKAYMGSISSKLSPSMLGNNNQVTREDNRLLGLVASKTPSTSLTTKTAVSPGSPANGFTTYRRSRGRSAIYNMARSPFLRGSDSGTNGYSGIPIPSTSLSLVENVERADVRSMSLKRRSYVLDDDIGSVGPIRRIRQKSNLLSAGSPRTNGVGIASNAFTLPSRQKLLLTDSENIPRTVEEINGNVIPSTSNALVTSNPRDASARTFKFPEKLTSKDVNGKTFKLTPSMLSGQALRSMEDVSSAELMLSVEDDHKFEGRFDATSSDAHDSIEQWKVKKNGHVETLKGHNSDMHHHLINHDLVVSSKDSQVINGSSGVVQNGVSDAVVQNCVSQPQHKQAFRMSALEDYVDLDDEDDLPCNETISPPLYEHREQGAHFTCNRSSSAEDLNLVKTTIQQEMNLPSGFSSSILSEPKRSSMGEQNNDIAKPTSGEATVPVHSTALPPPVALFDKPKQTNDPPAVFDLQMKAEHKIASSMPESSNRKPETKLEISSSLLNGSPMKSPVAEDGNCKSDTITSVSSSGLLASSAPIGSFTAASNNLNQISTSGLAIFTPSTTVSTVVPSGTGGITSHATSSTSSLGLTTTPTSFGGPVFKFGGSDPPAEVSVASTLMISAGDLKTNDVKDSANDKVGTVSQGTSVPPFSFAAPPSSNTAPVSSLSTSQVFNPATTFGFNSSASSSGTGATSSIFGANPSSASSDGTVAAPSVFSFGIKSSSSLANDAGPTGGATSPMFNFGSSSSASATSTAASFSTPTAASSGGATPPAFSFGASLSNTAPVTTAPLTFSFGSSLSNAAAVTNTPSAPSVFSFGGTSSANNSDPAPSNPFSNNWQTPKSSVFGSVPASTTPATGFAFGASAAVAPSPSPVFPFGNPSSGFSASPGNNFQMNTEDSMAEDPVQSTAPVFGQPPVSPSPTGFMFGSTVPAQANPFQFGGQQNPVAQQNPFQASGSLEFNAGGSFSLGSGAGDKSGRKFVKANRNKNRKK